VNVPAAIITLSSYPPMSPGSGITLLSIGEPFCIPWQNFINFSLLPKWIVCTISALFSLYFGSTLYPNSSNILLANTAVFKLLATTCGAKNSPFNKLVFWFNDGPISFPIPGAVSLSAHISTNSFFPTIYAPLVAIPAPRFFINDPTTISAPTSIGSFSSTNSP